MGAGRSLLSVILGYLPDEGDIKTYWVPGADVDNQSLHKW